MSTLLTAVPGDIPGLLRRASPVLYAGAAHVIDHMGERAAIMGSNTGLWAMPFSGLLLDLTDPTGRAHAAWWLTGRLDQHPGDDVWQAICRATTGIDMTPKQIDTLARLVLRLAGRTP